MGISNNTVKFTVNLAKDIATRSKTLTRNRNVAGRPMAAGTAITLDSKLLIEIRRFMTQMGADFKEQKALTQATDQFDGTQLVFEVPADRIPYGLRTHYAFNSANEVDTFAKKITAPNAKNKLTPPEDEFVRSARPYARKEAVSNVPAQNAPTTPTNSFVSDLESQLDKAKIRGYEKPGLSANDARQYNFLDMNPKWYQPIRTTVKLVRWTIFQIKRLIFGDHNLNKIRAKFNEAIPEFKEKFVDFITAHKENKLDDAVKIKLMEFKTANAGFFKAAFEGDNLDAQVSNWLKKAEGKLGKETKNKGKSRLERTKDWFKETWNSWFGKKDKSADTSSTDSKK